MSAGKREEVVLEVRPAPSRGSMTPFAAARPTIRQVVGRVGLGKVPLVTQLALHRGTFELPDGGLEVAALTGNHRVSGYEMEASIGMFGDKAGRCPVQLFVASLTIQSKSRSMRIRVTAAAAA